MQVRGTLPRADRALVALERCTRAARSAASAATNSEAAIRGGRDDLAGARVQRCESLLELARAELKEARTVLGDIVEALGDVDYAHQDERMKKRWDTPPLEWWRQCAHQMRSHVADTLAAIELVQKDWSRGAACTGDGYTACVQWMVSDAERVRDRWTQAMQCIKPWRDIALAVGDGLPASQSVIRKLPL